MKTWQIFFWFGLLVLAAVLAVHTELRKKDQAYAHSELRAVRMAQEISNLKIALYRCRCEINPCPVIK